MRTLAAIAGLLLPASLHAQVQPFFELTEPCNPIALHTCALPYPSDVYATPSATSPTGIHLIYPDGMFREELLAQLPSALSPQKVFNGSSGYSAATAILFELDSAPDADTLPEDGGEAVLVFDLDTGERMPIRAQINKYASSRRVSAPSHVIEIYPRSRWQFGGRYAAYLTKQLRADTGTDYTPSTGFQQALSNDGSALANYYAPVLAFFEQQGHAKDKLISSTFFTVRNESEVTEKLTRLSQAVYNWDHPIKDIRVRYNTSEHVAAFITGKVLVHNFRDDVGFIVYDENQAQENWIKFRLTLPHAANDQAVPITMFSHGLGLVKETDASVARKYAQKGVATLSIDHPNHGSRIKADGGYVMARLDVKYVPMQVGMMVQSSIDHMSVLKAIKTSIGALDVLPQGGNPSVTTDLANSGDGIADIDTQNIFFDGISLGGVLGSAFVSLAPDLKGAYFHVAGVGITSILSGSALWNPAFSRLEPDIADGAEALVLKAAMQHELDYGDGINFIHYLRNPQGMATAKPVLISAGDGDGIVPNFSTIAFAQIAGLPLVGEQHFAMPGSPQTAEPDQGYGVIQFAGSRATRIRFIDNMLTHFTGGKDSTAKNAWLNQYVLPR